MPIFYRDFENRLRSLPRRIVFWLARSYVSNFCVNRPPDLRDFRIEIHRSPPIPSDPAKYPRTSFNNFPSIYNLLQCFSLYRLYCGVKCHWKTFPPVRVARRTLFANFICFRTRGMLVIQRIESLAGKNRGDENRCSSKPAPRAKGECIRASYIYAIDSSSHGSHVGIDTLAVLDTRVHAPRGIV